MEASGLQGAPLVAAQAEARLDRGLLLFAQGDVPGAVQAFEWVLERQPGHVAAANNRAVATMYGCSTAGAIQQMEANLVTHPAGCLHEPFVLNLSSMYELHARPYRDEARSKLAGWAARCGPDDFDGGVLRAA